jgi:hypothetical protein
VSCLASSAACTAWSSLPRNTGITTRAGNN